MHAGRWFAGAAVWAGLAGMMSPAGAATRIELDYSGAPETEAFALKSKAICEEWAPRIHAILWATNGPPPPETVRLEFKRMPGVAATGGRHITVSAEWVTKKAPNDYGAVVHELVHVMQDYRGGGEGWLTEGIADYVRFFCYEPGAWTPRLNPDRSSYRDGYRVAGAFLAWLVEHKDPAIVRKLNAASRERRYKPDLFKEYTGSDLDSLWREFADTFRRKADGRAGGATPQEGLAAAAAAGRHIVVPRGLVTTAPFVMASGTHLRLERGAVLRGLAQAGPGAPLIRATGATDLRISGEGTLEGQEKVPVRPLKPVEPDALRKVAHHFYEYPEDVPRVRNILLFEDCTNVTVEGVTLRNAGSWTLRLNRCKGVTIRGVTIRNPYEAPCVDGIDPCDSEDVLIENCDIDTSDDAVCIKSMRQRPTRNIVIRNCRLRTICNAFKIGTDTVGTVENVRVEGCTVDGLATGMIWRVISAAAIESVDGGTVRNITVTNLTVRNARNALFVRLGLRKPRSDHEGSEPRKPGVIENVVFEHVRAEGIHLPCIIAGMPGGRVQDVVVRDVQVAFEGGGAVLPDPASLPELADRYPEASMWGELPASAFYLRHAGGVRLEDVAFSLARPDPRPWIWTGDAPAPNTRNVTVDGKPAAMP